MDKLFGQFSLQNILRQMFCGVVFLLPFFLFSAIVAVKEPPVTFQKVCINLHELNLSSVEFTSLAVISIIIGTLIYHLEKNIWSYGLQVIFTGSPGRSVVSVLYFVILLVAFLVYSQKPMPDLEVCLLILLTLLCLIIALIVRNKRFILITGCMWLGEQEKKSSIASRILSKVATWSDFIHCAQSCAWSWILGSWVCKYIGIFDINCDDIYRRGLALAFVILVVEAIFDKHRWRHVLYVINLEDKKYGKYSLEQSEEEYDDTLVSFLICSLLLLIVSIFGNPGAILYTLPFLLITLSLYI